MSKFAGLILAALVVLVPTLCRASTFRLAEGTKATVLVKEPCFSHDYGPGAYFDALRKHDAEGLSSYAKENAILAADNLPPTIAWLQPGTNVRVLDNENGTARLAIENGAMQGHNCYARENPPSSTYRRR